jgi:hypothetical protein
MPVKRLNPNKIAGVWSDFGATNYGSDPIVSAGSVGGDGAVRAYVSFEAPEWSQIPSNATITGMTLHMYCSDVFDSQVSTAGVHNAAYRVTSDWTEAGITWNNKPTNLTTIVAVVNNIIPGNWQAINLNNMAVEAFNNLTTRSRGVVIKSDDEFVHYDAVEFVSDDNGNFLLRPVIDVTYTAAPTIVSVAPNSAKSAIVVSGTGVDTSASRVPVGFSTDDITFSFMGDATITQPNWTITDNTKAPSPGIPSTSLSVVNGDDIRITWAASSQEGIRRYYKAYQIYTDGTNSPNSTSMNTTLIPNITKYTVERLIEGQTSWVKLGDIASGSTLEFIDTTLPTNTTAQYRVYATNSQGTVSGASLRTINTEPPPMPIFSALEAVNETTFRLTGSGAIVLEEE